MSTKARGPPAGHCVVDDTFIEPKASGNRPGVWKEKGEELYISIQKAFAPEYILEEEDCGLCGVPFHPENFFAHVSSTEEADATHSGRVVSDMGKACPTCLEYFGQRNPERFPNLETLRYFVQSMPGTVYESKEACERREREAKAVRERAYEDFARILNNLMEERGISGIEELAERAEEAGYYVSAEEFAEELSGLMDGTDWPRSAFGKGIELGLGGASEYEVTLLMRPVIELHRGSPAPHYEKALQQLKAEED